MKSMIRPNAAGVFPRVVNGPHELCLGNSTAYQILVFKNNGMLHLGVEGKGCWHFTFATHASYVAEKFGLGHTMGDAVNLADFIGDQLTSEPVMPRQGTYAPAFTKEVP